MRQTSLRLASLLLLLALPTGCGTLGTAPSLRAPQGMAQAYGTTDAAKTRDSFMAELRKRGISISEADMDVLVKERTLIPSGKFAPRPAENLTAEQNLDVHFKKHGHEFSPNIKSAEEYLSQGLAAAGGERGKVKFFFDTTSFKKKYQSHVVRWVPTTKDFCAFRADGAMTTYYQNNSVALKRFIEVPELE